MWYLPQNLKIMDSVCDGNLRYFFIMEFTHASSCEAFSKSFKLLLTSYEGLALYLARWPGSNRNVPGQKNSLQIYSIKMMSQPYLNGNKLACFAEHRRFSQ